MTQIAPITTVKDAILRAGGVDVVAAALDLSTRSIYKWMKKNSLPRSEYTGETTYSETIATLSNGQFESKILLEIGRPKVISKPLHAHSKTIGQPKNNKYVQKVAL